MRAIVYAKYGPPDVLHLEELAKPAPKDDEVLVRVRATTVSSGDCRARSLEMPRGFGVFARPVFGFFGPRQPVLGTELAGDVEAIGKDVRAFGVGDAVFAFSGIGMGCHAQYRAISEHRAIARKPANLSYEEAAALSFGGLTALDFFRRGALQRGERVLVNGASGAVGTAAVQLAKHLGAHVTGVCSTVNLELVQSLGADEVIDYTRHDFTRSGKRYDVIVDTVGTAPFSRCRDSLTRGGRLLLVLGTLADLLRVPWVAITTDKKVVAGPAGERAEDIRRLAELAESGELKPVIDRRYPLEHMVEAHRYVDTGRKRGSVVITLDPQPGAAAAGSADR